MRWVLSFLVSAFAAGASAAEDGLLIVAPAALADSLGDFVAFKAERLPTSLVTLEDALAHTEGVDDAERLKRYLYDRRKSDGVRYVLLVGDADVLPVRYMALDRDTEPAFHYAFYPSDLYYADVAKPDGSFETWNAQTEGFHAAYFGEVRGEHNKADPINYDQVDYRPELAVGRWPVSAPEQAALVAAKTMRYQLEAEKASRIAPYLCFSGRPWPARAGLVMVGGWVDARPQFEELYTLLGTRFDIEKRYYDGEAYQALEPSAEQVVGLLNGGVGLLLHAGHGSDTTWHECIGTGNLPEMTNGEQLAVVMSAGCSTARFATLPPYEPYEDGAGVRHTGTNNGEVFDAPPPAPACYARGEFNLTGLGEQMVVGGAGGAVAYIGCNTGSQPCALTLMAGFVEGAATIPNPRLGDCWTHAVSYYHERENLEKIEPTESWYPASIFFQGMKFMVFGDPTIPVGMPPALP
ncbi:MAG: hypothetical protein IT431_10750 [Phycisphaerales bacterium]|nr:hypothetical protein [Phycisphaerales bacterium]